jgi:uncharacterized cupin superfamily protein
MNEMKEGIRPVDQKPHSDATTQATRSRLHQALHAFGEVTRTRDGQSSVRFCFDTKRAPCDDDIELCDRLRTCNELPGRTLGRRAQPLKDASQLRSQRVVEFVAQDDRDLSVIRRITRQGHSPRVPGMNCPTAHFAEYRSLIPEPTSVSCRNAPPKRTKTSAMPGYRAETMSTQTSTLPNVSRDSRTVRSFIDLRAFAAATAAITPSRTEADRFLSARSQLPLPPGPVTVAALRLDGGHGTVASQPADEFLIVLEGELKIAGAGATLTLPAGRSGVLPGGLFFSWTAQPGTVAIAMRCSRGPSGARQAIAIDEAAPRSASNAPLAELLIGPTPSCRNHTDYSSANGEFMCGTWDSTPYHRKAMRYRHYELMHLLEGEVTFTDGAGRTQTFGQGDVFLCEQDSECSWHSAVHVTKVYSIFRPG